MAEGQGGIYQPDAHDQCCRCSYPDTFPGALKWLARALHVFGINQRAMADCMRFNDLKIWDLASPPSVDERPALSDCQLHGRIGCPRVKRKAEPPAHPET